MKRKSIITTALTVLAIAGAGSGVARAAIVRLKAKASTDSSLVHLGDIADVLDDDPAVVAKLRSMTIAPAPRPERELRLEFAMIRARLVARGVDMTQTEFLGSSSVTVIGPDLRSGLGWKTSSQLPGREDWQSERAESLLSEEVERYIRIQVPELGLFDVKVQFPPREAYAIVNAANRGFEVSGGKPPWHRPQTMQVRFVNRKGRIQSLLVGVGIALPDKVLVARRALRPGDVATSEDVEW